MEAQRITSRKSYFSWISWGSILAGVIVGLATYMLLTLLGLAAGLSAVDPQSTDPTGSVPIATGIWTGISMLISAFVGGYVAARMSGLSRLGDGLFHGFVSWGVTTVLFAYLATTAVGSLLGGTFNVLDQGLQGAAQGAVSQAAAPDVNVAQAGQQLRDKAAGVVDQATALIQGDQVPAQARNVADDAVSALAQASWWLFAGILLSMLLGIAGGAAGIRAASPRSHDVSHRTTVNTSTGNFSTPV
ncbi:MAG: hypothetical protein ABIQ54_03700 [Gammaproteobacteria bacterium]